MSTPDGPESRAADLSERCAADEARLDLDEQLADEQPECRHDWRFIRGRGPYPSDVDGSHVECHTCGAISDASPEDFEDYVEPPWEQV